MESLFLVLLCLLIGLALQRSQRLPSNAAASLNQFVLFVPLPALAFYYIPEIELGRHLLYPLGVAWISIAASWLVFGSLGRWLCWSRKLTGCLVLTSGLGNTSFIGFPVIEALYGKEGLVTALIVDQPGSFVVLSTVGIVIATLYSGSAIRTGPIIRKILLFPPFIGFSLAMSMNVIDLHFPELLRSGLYRLGSTITPVALVAVGLQLKLDRRSKHLGFLAAGLGFKLLAVPGILYVLYVVLLKGSGIVVQISLMESAMAPMITGVILASTYGLKPRLANMMVGIGIPLSLITMMGWYWLISNS
ncbi:MAG: AEC family transporter [Flavobacteriales bacterium]